MKAAFYTLGCKVNQYETQYMTELLINEGFEIVSHHEKADVYIINSCTVTGYADKKTRQAVRRFKRENPFATVILAGCMPQAYPDEAEKLGEADYIIGNREIGRIKELVGGSAHCRMEILPHERNEEFGRERIKGFGERTRAFLKIQDGCNRYCSYCIIPTSRGFVRSKPLSDIRKEAAELANAGYKEIVLVGINLSSYGSDCGEKFQNAVKAVCETDGIERVRLGSLEPDHITDEVLEALAQMNNFCPQFHISLQSGCNRTLKAMNRHYTAEEYEALCTAIRNKFKDASITTDLMVGFPGETEEDFRESVAFAEKIGFEKVHIFPYSRRPGTRADKMPEQIDKSVKEGRAAAASEICEQVRAKKLAAQCGKTFDVLFEGKSPLGYAEGYTANYTPVRVKSDRELIGELHTVRITSFKDDVCIGELVE